MKNLTFLNTITLFLFFTTVIIANNPTTNGSSTDWYTASAWTPNGVPNLTHYTGLQDVVVSHNMNVGNLVITSSNSIHVTNGATLTIDGNLNFRDGAVILVDAGSTLIVTGKFHGAWNHTATINGTLDVGGDYKVTNGAFTHNINGNVTVGGYFQVQQGTVDVSGALDITGKLKLSSSGIMQGFSGHVTYGSYSILSSSYSYLICGGINYSSNCWNCTNPPPDNGMDFSTCGAYTLPVCNNFTNAGSINGAQTSCGSYNPGTMGNTGNPSGGSGGSTQYQWQISSNNSSWSNISGASGSSYDPPTITSTKYYRRGARRSGCSTYIFTASITKAVTSNFTNAGSINGAQTSCGSYNPSTMGNAGNPGGGSGGGAQYYWQISSNNSSWSSISGATGNSYNPPTITSTKYYRRGVRRSGCSTYIFTGSITKAVTSNFTNAGSINGAQSSCGSYNPSNMGNANSPSGGSGDTQYQWQYKTTESWVDIGSANSATYDPSTIFITTQYQRGARRSGCSNYVFTTSITKAVDNQIIASNTTSTNSITEGQTKSLEGSPSGGTWSIVTGSGSITGTTYTPADINTATTVVIRYTIAADGDCAATNDDVTFTVTPVCAVASNTTSTASITELQTKSLEGSPSGGTWSIVSGGGSITGATYTPADITADTSIEIKYTIASDGSCAATTSDRTFTVTPVVISWDGSEDNDWSTPENWSTNTVPANNNAVVVIPSGLSNYPTASGPVSVNSVIMNSGSSLIAEDTFTGALTYNRTLNDDWHLIASPVVGETIENMHLKNNFIEAGNGDIGLAAYQHDDNTWGFYKNTSTGVIVSGQGYSSKLASLGDVSFTGTMATTNIDITSFGRTIDYNLVGNPYPSYINIESFLNENSNSLEEKTLWMDRFDILEGKRVYKPISFTSNLKHIAPTQGFFVQPKESTVLSFTESMQSHQPVDTFEKTSSSERPEIKLLMTNGISTKYTDIFYIEGTTTGFDNGYDSSIFNSTASFSLYTNTITNSAGRKLAIQSLPNSDYESMVVPFGITADADKEITFSATAINLPAGIKVYLEDRELNVFTELVTSDTDVYKVDLAAAVNGVGRFYLHTSQKVLDVSDVPILTNIKIYTTTNTNLRIVGLPEGAKALKLYNIIGQEIMSTSFNTNGVKDIALPNLSKGVYTVQLKIGSEIIREKIFLE